MTSSVRESVATKRSDNRCDRLYAVTAEGVCVDVHAAMADQIRAYPKSDIQHLQ